ncbi:MAG: type VI secretion protein [Rhodospirillales bacterium]|nr:MAG: type VI secretion protein [Rhodospirillales bacterium]
MTDRFGPRHGPIRVSGLVLAVLLSASGCATPSWLCVNPSGVSNLTIRADPNANLDSAVAVDLLFVRDDQLTAQLLQTPALDYFARRDQIRRDYTENDVRRWSWELAPGQQVDRASVSPPCGRKATFMFASYATPGDHRLRLGDDRTVTVILGETDFQVQP